MHFYSLINRDIYYTPSHEWIQFINNEAYIGISYHRLSEARTIKKINYTKLYGFKPKGDVLAIIHLDARQVAVHMPVAGKIISIHHADRLLDPNLLLADTEHRVWLAKISPDQPLQKSGLWSEEQYRLHLKR